ncbi:hypothetical protein QUF80_19050 [Desulfococcaceae bacterium HSG8]|nr:hypothetical protein [Desulfococcaceae bacterium HSG8]
MKKIIAYILVFVLMTFSIGCSNKHRIIIEPESPDQEAAIREALERKRYHYEVDEDAGKTAE